ncbi:rhodanese-like domain-containing protein [uncultured Psychroserpens sp.]|uniref:rhodanese-like domain-containing protein n=1 Tax=uncultured Psychroserpens sp. TaxID=255436 RepID=UPI002610CBB9|nr:rhodanese-like domain-containing protein [uncultured Psychroserpens sp.]
MKKILLFIIALVTFQLQAQENIDELLNEYNQNNIPYISVKELAKTKTKPIILDAREPQEYQVSHLKDAICVGYDSFELDAIEQQIPNKDDTIVVYCSLGIRSEVIADKLKKAGYTNVTNLYGGIFEWKNKNYSVYNSKEQETDSVHTFSKEWSKWLKRGQKVYPKDSITND